MRRSYCGVVKRLTGNVSQNPPVLESGGLRFAIVGGGNRMANYASGNRRVTTFVSQIDAKSYYYVMFHRTCQQQITGQ